MGLDGAVTLTAAGEAAAERLVRARHDAVADLVQDWNPEQHAELAALLRKLARHLAEGPAPVPAEPVAAGAGAQARHPRGLACQAACCCAVGPGGVFVVEGAGFEAAVEDADEPVGEAPEGVVVPVSGGAVLVVEGAGAG